MKSILGEKVKMKQVFSKDGERFPVTEIIAGPCQVVFEKKLTKDGYEAIVLGFGKKTKDEKTPKFLREVRVVEDEKVPVGEVITVEKLFATGDLVNVTGISKGWGFAGVVKRHHFKGGPRTHGQSDRERAPGSIGQSTTPGRVYKGKRMAGKAGNNKKTVKNLLVVHVDGTNNRILIKGAVPGKRNGLLIIKNTNKKVKNFSKEIIFEKAELRAPLVQ